MKKTLAMIALGLMAIVGLATPAYADKYNAICDPSSPNYQNLSEDIKSDICEETVNDGRSIFNVVQFLINVALGVLGVVAIFVLVIAGQRYVTAQGDPGQLKTSKDMILWGLVGLVIALLAYAIVNFIVTEVPGDAAGNVSAWLTLA